MRRGHFPDFAGARAFPCNFTYGFRDYKPCETKPFEFFRDD
ncbi:hypothetical protein S7335_2475 [Synechococcus sp. PCC 7335]|nr:hypothetical protein S7335_2475 [Synechococcus sp. PCC 7335]